MVDPAGVATRLAYDPAGRLAEVHRANGTTSTWTYDRAGQPVALLLHAPGGEVLGECVFTHDTDGNRTTARRKSAGKTTEATYGYDNLGRLTRAGEGPGAETIVWDAVGNRLAVNENAPAAYDAADQLLTAARATYRHDAAGNLVAEIASDGDTLTLEYDAFGRPTVVRTRDGTATFGYGGLGRRVTRTDRTGTTRRI